MTSIRTSLRNILKDRLRRGKTLAGNNVFSSRSQNIWQESLPAIIIYPRSEDVEEFSQAPRENKHVINYVIEIVADGKTDEEAQEKTETIMDEVERLIAYDDSLNDCASDIYLIGVEYEWNEDGEKPISSAKQIYRLIFSKYAPEDRRDQKVRDFNQAHIDWDVNTANDPDPEATDELDFTGL